jgi:organic radical activating enzyme
LTAEIRDGLLHTEAVEINAAWHCNIRCAWCSHASPGQERSFADTGEVGRDLATLARVMRVEHVRVLGGEPLLHPDLPALFAAIRASGLSQCVRVLTNGLGLHRAAPSFWRGVDEVHVSEYPSTSKHIRQHADELRDLADRYGTEVRIKVFDNFRVSYRRRSDDAFLTERIYQTCQIGNAWRCLTVDRGIIYRCPQSAHLHRAGQLVGSSDFLRITEIASADEMATWLTQPHALESCQLCLGSVGTLRPHQQVQLGMPLFAPGEVDYAYLAELSRDVDAGNSCITNEQVLACPEGKD